MSRMKTPRVPPLRFAPVGMTPYLFAPVGMTPYLSTTVNDVAKETHAQKKMYAPSSSLLTQAERNLRRRPRKVLVLGATSGIAQAFMRLLAPRGTSFFLVARNGSHLKAVADDLRVRGAGAIHAEVVDLDLTAEHPALLGRAAAALDGIDCALIAHGVLGDQMAAEHNFGAAAAALQTNFISAVSLITWLANDLADRRQGTLAVITSVAGDRGRKSNYVYGSAKAGLNTFLDGVRNRLAHSGVQVLTVRPGFVATRMTAHVKQGFLFATPEVVARDILEAIDAKRDIVYTPWFWRWIMGVVRAVPEWKFKRMNL